MQISKLSSMNFYGKSLSVKQCEKYAKEIAENADFSKTAYSVPTGFPSQEIAEAQKAANYFKFDTNVIEANVSKKVAKPVSNPDEYKFVSNSMFAEA